ncbi:poly-gamma-glutamate biosynthesis protein [Halobacteriales archaeon QS_1_67_19]|nr:MAG: poly-gamma-glutamate biosynthesis protein [Halobacteriales archaeon QS_1_67_19]
MARLGFTGDVMLGRKVEETHRRGSVTDVWGTMRDRLRALDGLFVNLECCLSSRGERWTRTHRPFHFRADPDWAVSALEAAGVDWTNLANNHLLDYGETALQDTVDHLDSAGIAHSGAGENEEAAFAPATVEVPDEGDDPLRVTFVSATDNTPEFAAGADSPGTAHLDLGEGATARERMAPRLAHARRTEPDLLVASLHWGPNMVTEPPEHFRAFARWLAERGADLVHGHSAHVFQGIEVHEGTPILYDCGDFVDDYAVDDQLRNDRSFLFEVAVADRDIARLRLVPTQISGCAVHEADPEAAAWSSDRMRELSAEFGTELAETQGESVLEL